MTGERAFFLILFVTVLAGCRGGVRSDALKGMDDGSPETVEMEVKSKAPGKDAGAIHAPPDSDEKCMTEFLKLEAKRRANEMAMEPVFRKAVLNELLVELITEVSSLNSPNQFKTVSEVAGSYWKKLEPLRPETSEDDLKIMENVIKRRMEAYFSCMAVASGDSSFCKVMDEPQALHHQNSCRWLYAIYTQIVAQAVKKGKECAAVMQNSGIGTPATAAAFCYAVAGRRGDKCPWEETSLEGAYCRAAAGRGTSLACKKVKLEERTNNRECCEMFEWRFMSATGSSATAYDIPEIGALSGDTEGCRKALQWGLFENLAPLFNVESFQGAKTDLSQLFGEFTCPLVIYWTQREPPL
jgi:hypothetical protein